MGFDFNGFVLRAPRTAPSNSITTEEVINGVNRDFKPLSSDYTIASPELVEVAADQYRTAVLLRPDDGQTEYLVWAANTANLADVVGFEVINEGTATFPTGTTPIDNTNTIYGTFGTDRIILIDDANRSIAEITSLTLQRGDTQVGIELVGHGTWNPVTGVFTITDVTTLSALGGGVSRGRNDRVIFLKYVISAPTFWWSKNDIYGNRFIWDGALNRWRPLRGTPPRNLGQILKDTEYALSPTPLVTAGEFLPGDSATPDAYSMVRIGTRPDASSIPVAPPVAASGFSGIKVVTEDELEVFDFGTDPELSGVVGSESGTLIWNPTFIEEFAGQTIFYSYDQFVDQEEIEPLGDLEDGNLNLMFIAPIPGPLDYPFIRIGSRTALDVKFADTEADLALLTIEEGEVGVALSTGRLKFSEVDLAKADPGDAGFDNTYLGAQIFYDGIALTRRPVPTCAAIQLVDSGGDPTTVNGKNHKLYIPDAKTTPSPGVSGVLHVPDTTGTIPNTTIPAGIRYGGGSGLIREFDGPWDIILFTKVGQIETIYGFDDDDEPPLFRFRIPRGIAYVDKRLGSAGSEVLLGRQDLKQFEGEEMYFLQSGVQPSVYAEDARMVARVRNQWTLEGTEVLVFSINNQEVVWDASTNPGGVPTSDGGTFSADEIATSLNAVAPSDGDVVAQNGRVLLRSTLLVNGFRYGDIEIGFGPGGVKDLTGPAALGFLPGWKVRISNPNAVLPLPNLHWLPDNGSHLGVFRSPFNLHGRSDKVSDVTHISRFKNVVLSSSISDSPVVVLDRPPLENVAGYDENIFFQLQDGLVQFSLKNYDEVFYEFGVGKFSWADSFHQQQTIEQPINSLFMGQAPVIPNSFRLPGKGLRVSTLGQPFEDQILDEDFLLDAEGDSGLAFLIETVGALKQLGSRGEFSAGGTVFTDTSSDVNFLGLVVKAGWQIKITQGDAQGTYIVAADATVSNSLTVTQPFPISDSVVPWELYEGKTREEFDLGIVADSQYVQFQHLPEDPWKIRVLSPLGDVPTSAAQQEVTRLVAVLGDALASNRGITIRYGQLSTADEAGLVGLTRTNLGAILNSARYVPNPLSLRFADDAFSIRIGSKTYTFADGNLIKVAGDVSISLVGDVIEVQGMSGLLNFGSEVFEQFDGQDAIYVEEFLTSSLLVGNGVEYAPETGLLNFSTAAFGAYGGTEVYLVESMSTSGGVDVTLNPIQGSFLFTKPLREFQIVEVNYFRAENGTGNMLREPVDPDDPESELAPVEVTEQLPLFVRLDPATTVESSPAKKWDFNPTKRTVDTDIGNEPAFYVGSTLYNIGSSPVASFLIDNETEVYQAVLEQGVDAASEVLITYAVFEAFGGEQTYTVSQPPVYRPPFRIEADQTSFVLETDRTADISPGKLLRVAEFPFYITASTYDVGADTTTVEFLPETQLEAGSRDPGSDSLSLISDIPLATDIMPDAPDGFWLPILNQYEPINRGFQSIIFVGDLTAIAVVGHLLELGGLPFIISGATQIDEGTRTKIDVTSFFPRGFAFGQDAAKISVRPVYPPLPIQFIGRGAVIDTEPSELILFGEKDVTGNLLPGRTLRPSIDYTLNVDDGSVEFLNPPEGPLEPTQYLYLRHIQQKIITPILANQFILNPRFDARFVYVSPPSVKKDPITGKAGNNRLGKILRATYTFSNPDTFFYHTVPLLNYIGEVAEQVALDVAAQLPSQGPSPAIVPPVQNATQGRLGLKSQLQDLQDTDRAARVFLEFYNVNIVNFEQIIETITGNIVGDRDGKFKFFIGKGKEVPPPGYEDAITGELNRRNLFAEVFFGYNPSATFMRRDPVVDPTDFEIAGDQLEGPFIDPDFLADLQRLQRDLAANDVDDLVLFARTRKKLRLFPLRLEAFGRYRVLGQPSQLSRLFPEFANYFTLTDPGIGADLETNPINPGVYAFRKKIKRLSIKGNGGTLKIELPKRASTFFKGIAEVGNPVLGTIENIGGITVRNRLPRARIFAYSNVGFPELDNIPFSPTNFTGNPRPAVIATPLPLHELPLNEMGLPDVAQLAAQGGEVFDLTTGDPDLFTPGFSVWTDPKGSNLPKVAFGHPDGYIIDVVSSQSYSYEFAGISSTATKSIFVGEVLFGCVITFVDEDGVQIGPNQLLEAGEEEGTTGGLIQLKRGDTILVTPPDASLVAPADIDDPSTNSEKAAQVKGLPTYRVAFDVGVDRTEGELRDITFPSFDDPSMFGLKEILGQEPPKPFSNVEGFVTFRNGFTEPVPIPALTGGFTDDSGDYTLPYLYAQNTEIDQLGIVAGSFNNLFADSAIPNAVYPDEVQGVDGTIVGALAGGNVPAAIHTGLDATPVTTAGFYTPNSGIGDVVPFDVLLVETGQSGLGLPAGSQGILSVGAVTGGASGSILEPPRFVSPTALGANVRYRFKSAMSFVNQGTLEQPPGMVVRRVGAVTQFDITQISTGILVFNDGTPATISGGLNNLFAGTNIITINLWTSSSNAVPVPVFLQSVTLDFGAGTATGDLGSFAFGVVTADDNFIYVGTVAPFVTITPGILPPFLPEDPLAPGDTLPLWFTIDINAPMVGGVSITARIEQDRLTFSEGYDFRTVLPRTEPPVAAIAVVSELSVDFVESKSTPLCTINDDVSTNGGVPYTFLARNEFAPLVGSFDPLPFGNGRGAVKVMAFEGHGNIPIVTTGNITFSALPSSRYGEDQAVVIAEGTGVAGTATERNFRISSNGLTLLTASGQGFGAIMAGDALVIRGSDEVVPKAAVTAGTYLVRHVIEPNEATTQYRSVDMFTGTLPVNTESGWANPIFPTLVASTVNANGQLILSSTLLMDGVTPAWNPAGGFLYFVPVLSPLSPSYTTANLKVPYTAVDTLTNTFTISLAGITDFAGAAKTADDVDALPVGTVVSGFNRFDVTLDHAPEDQFPRNTVGSLVPIGFDVPIGGFSGIIIAGPLLGFIAYEIAAGNLVAAPVGVDELAVQVATPITNLSFDPNPDAYVYANVPQYIEMDQSALNTDWDTIHPTPGLFALMPGDRMRTRGPALLPGFHAQAGVFLEPSWVQSTANLSGLTERVVDASHSVGAGDIGFRVPTAFGEVDPEDVSWEIRRIRRFHDVLQNIGELLGPLRYVYQIRRGVITSYGLAPVGTEAFFYPYVVTATGGTNLGPFNDEFVNINPGDLFRLFDDDGVTLLDEIEIAGIQSGTQIWLKEPGITAISAAVSGKPFEIYLRKVPVPHEQSNAQLFAQITDQLMLERTADYANQEGGFVPTEADVTEPRHLKDSDDTLNFAALGILAGDILVIDAAGDVQGPTGVPTTGQERGSRPFGDRSVPNRTFAQAGQEAPFIAGGPSELDDNRGWYRITEVTSDALTVSSATGFSNDPGGEFVTFGTDAEYAVLPTISGSTAAFADPPGGPGLEGQMDLRPTALAGESGSPPNSFKGNLFSLAPFSYKIIRPSTLFSDEAIDLVLLMRERTLSFLEEFDTFFRQDKYGSYFIFQQEEHVGDLGNPLIPDEGKGVMSNELIDGVRGLVMISPYANNSDALGVLDRRFWVKDSRLDTEFPPNALPGTPSYATLDTNVNNPGADIGDGRPVLTDLIDEVLDDNDQFRELRFAWLDFRVNREDGTLVEIRRFIEQLPKKKRKEALQLRWASSLSKATETISGG